MPRKKQAVKKARSSSIKPLANQNAHQSPLISLPAEVREKILFYAVGGTFVHVKFVSADERTKFKCPDESTRPKSHETGYKDGGLCHAICTAQESEKEACVRAIGGKAYVPSHDSAEFYVQSYQTRHKDCNPKGPSNRTLRADLSVLGASRQLYEEANYILWTTNTFSFEDYVSFDAFVDSLTPAQKRDFRSLSISTDIGDMARSRNEYYADNYRWVYSFSTARIQSLRGLQCLYFCFELRYSSSFYLRLESSLKRRLEPFMRMRALPLKQVTVTISDDIFQILRYRIGERRLTAAMKNEYANDLRAQLFDPRGAEIMRAEFDALVVSYKRKWEETEAEALERAKKSAAYAEAKAGDRARIAEKATVRADEAAKKAE